MLSDNELCDNKEYAFAVVLIYQSASGVRPIVDRYNINKYGTMDWRFGNKAVLDMVGESDT